MPKLEMKIKIASVRKFSIVVASMKAFIVAVVFLAAALSVHAQGQIVITGSESLMAAPFGQNFENQATESYMIVAPSIPTLSPSGFPSGIGSVSQTPSFVIQVVPEPSSFALLSVGLLTGAITLRRCRISARF